MKRLFDIVAALVILLAAIPVMAMAALLVRIYLGSPVLFKQQRPGLKMVPFHIYKLRTMTNEYGADGELLPDNVRLTLLGKWMRKLSVDELPQLVNVLKGEMSLIGPRPLLMKYLPYYSEREKLRFNMRPGITGLAQISGRNNIKWDDRLNLDAEYVEKWSFWLDMSILFRTVMKVIRQEDVVDAPGAGEVDLDNERGYLKEVSA